MQNRKIILAGGSGFLGTELARYFAPQNDVVILTRHLPAQVEPSSRLRWVAWDGEQPDPGWVQELEGADLVVNLSGRSVDCRYHDRERHEILESRVQSTLAIGRAIAGLRRPPACWINLGSATIYRHAPEEPQTEQRGIISPWRADNFPAHFLDRLRQTRNRWLAGWLRSRSTGRTGWESSVDWTRLDFSVEVCRRWEEAFWACETPATRRVILRTAIVLGRGGALPAFRSLARWGMGGRQGTGSQRVSWVHALDFARMVEWIADEPKAHGVYNCAAPGCATNVAFMRALRHACGRRWGLPVPASLLELGAWLIGTETELVLKSRWVYPQRALAEGFRFQYADLEEALADLIR